MDENKDLFSLIFYLVSVRFDNWFNLENSPTKEKKSIKFEIVGASPINTFNRK